MTAVAPQHVVRTVFLADDDADDLLLFHDALEKVDPSIVLHQVDNGLELMSLLTHLSPDLIFLDLDMPGKNGLECLVEIRNNPVYRHLPVIVFSSTTRTVNISTAYEMGAHLFFVKPGHFTDLVNSIQSILAFDWRDPSNVKAQFFSEGRYRAFD